MVNERNPRFDDRSLCENRRRRKPNQPEPAPLRVLAPAGPIQGRFAHCPHTETPVRQFLGIPYAAAPTGVLRWQPPQPLSAWSAPFSACEYGRPAPQSPSPLFEVTAADGTPLDNEDCLYLNVFAPPNCSDKPLPVMLWIHGGSFYLGAASQSLYSGNTLAASGRAIVVTTNYRLGALGFLRLCDISDVPATGNEGLHDQLAALRWVKENIKAFGGDPDNITLFGESAGAMSITCLLAAQPLDGRKKKARLFHKAILQSGNPEALHKVDDANEIASTFCDYLQKLTGNRNLTCAPVADILKAQEAIIADPRIESHWGQLPFKPVLDGGLVSTSPLQAIQQGAGADITLMAGSNLEEWNLFSAARPETFSLDEQQIRTHLKRRLPSGLIDPLLSHYHQRAAAMGSSPWPLWSRAWNQLLTDMTFTLPGLRLLSAHRGTCYHYQFTQPLTAQPVLGACHAAELGYVFGTHHEEELAHFYGAESNPHHLSSAMREAWLSFAETGSPGDDWPSFHRGGSWHFGDHPSGHRVDIHQLTALWQSLEDEHLRGYL